MSYYALTDSDWPWDDEGEGRAIVVKADTPEEAIKVATEKMRAEDPHDGGIGWKVARLNLVGFEGATWELGEEPVYDGFTYYSDGINGRPDAPPSSPQPASTALVEALEAMLEMYGPPSTVANQCDYPDQHPITLARSALSSSQSTSTTKAYRSCGGCGATDPSQRCIGCLHSFFDSDWPEQMSATTATFQEIPE